MGGSLKRYNRLDNHMLIIGVVLPILLFFISMNATYAFFTASAMKKEATARTGIIRIEFNGDLTEQVNSTTVSETTKVLPGDILTLEGVVKNTGNSSCYVILEFKIDIATSGEETASSTQTKYYTFSGSTLTEIIETESGYSAVAFTLDENATKSFTLTYEFDLYVFDNTYKNATANYFVSAYSIQTKNLTDTTAVTTMLLEQAQGE